MAEADKVPASMAFYMYHEIKAPEGKLFKDEAELKAAGSGWVDTTAKFKKAEQA